MKKKIIAGLLILASMATMAGCASTPGSINDGKTSQTNEKPDKNNGNNNSSGTSAAGGVRDYEFDERTLGGCNVDNSAIVTDMIAAANDGQNVMFSPTSLNLALGLAGEGASGEGRELINAYLGYDEFGDRALELMEGFEDYNYDGGKNGYSCKLEVANALWVDKKIKLTQSFIKAAENKYQAGADEVDFSKADKACKTINKWADKNTYGLIPEIITPDVIGPDTVLCITNSLYFEAPWSEEWTLRSDEEDFTLFDGSTQQIQYISSSGGAYYENEYATAFGCSYVNGIQFIGILPKEEGEFTLEELDIAGLIKSRSYDFDELYYRMPRLNFETSNDLTNIFKAIGMGSLFDEGAGFDGIAEGENLYISSIIQKTRLELDQYGTKAAAVTAMTMDCATSALPDEEPIIKRVYLDRPFAFLIYDAANDEILFMGKVVTALE